MEFKRIDLDTGISTRMIDTGGNGTPVVLIHGLAASIEIWENVIPLLAESHRVVAVDLPGFGESDKPNVTYKAAFFVDQLRAFLDAASIERAHFIGSSMGASLLVRMAPSMGNRMASATLANPGGFARYIHPFLRVPTTPLLGYPMGRPMWLTNWFAVRLAMADNKNATKELIGLADRMSKKKGAHRAFVRTLKGFASPFGVFDQKTFRNECSSLTTPTQIIWGKQDKIFPHKQMTIAKKWLPHAETALIDKCGHYPQVEQPEELVHLFEAFIMHDAEETVA